MRQLAVLITVKLINCDSVFPLAGLTPMTS